MSDAPSRRVTRALTAIGYLLLAVAAVNVVAASVQANSTATTVTAGSATVLSAGGGSNVPITGGGSSTQFTLGLPTGSACSGDSATQGYKWSTYIVPSSVNVNTLTFNNNGPITTDTSLFHQPIYDVGSSKVVNKTTGSGDGLVVGVPAMSFGVFTIGNFPAGSYNIGIACVLSTTQPASLDKFWNAQITVVANAADQPGGFTWTVVETPVTTTSSSTTSTTSPSTTSSTSTTSTSTTSTSTTSSTTTSTSTTSSTTTSTTQPTTTTSTTSTTAQGGTTTTTQPVGAITLSKSSVAPGDQVTINSAGWKPGSTTTITVDSAGSSSTTTSTTSTTQPTTTTSTTSTTQPTTTTSTTQPTTTTTSTTQPTTTTSTTQPTTTSSTTSIAANAPFEPRLVAYVTTASPKTLGTMTAAASGTVSGPVTIPADLPSGNYILTLTGTGANGTNRVVSTSFTVSSSGATTTVASDPSTTAAAPGATVAGVALARTGMDAGRSFLAALNVIGAGVLLTIAADRRRRETARR